jgi:hypothetical protein
MQPKYKSKKEIGIDILVRTWKLFILNIKATLGQPNSGNSLFRRNN